MPETTIRLAEPAEELAGPLITEHHKHLRDARILFLFTSATRKKHDRVRLASAGRMSVLQRFLASGLESMTSYDFIVMIGERQWGGLTKAQRIALVDHELCHCKQSEKVNRRGVVHRAWYIAGHDLEEFSDVVRRHGLWKTDVKNFAQVVPHQLEMNDTAPAAAPPAERVTQVEPDGIVASTSRVDPIEEAEHARRNQEAVDHLLAASPPATNGVEHDEGWQSRAGLGAGELEQHRRRRRGTRSSETVSTT